MMTLLVLIRSVHFAATLLVAGALVFDLVAGDVGVRFRRPFVRWASAVAVLSGILWVGSQGAMIGGAVSAVDLTLLRRLVTETQFGQVMAVRLLLGVILFLWRPTSPLARAALGVMLAGSLAWCGHAAAGTGASGGFHLASDAIHCVAAGAWLGGLFCLTNVLRQSEPSEQAIKITRRFSTVALVSVSVLVVSGLINAWFLVGTVTQLIATGYGRTLILKLALFAAMLGLAGVSRWHVLPRLTAAGSITDLRRNTAAEAVLGLLVIAVVAWLGVQPPAGHFH